MFEQYRHCKPMSQNRFLGKTLVKLYRSVQFIPQVLRYKLL
jgi:hypothetical protein